MKEFRPAFLFLAKFLAIYFIGNILYGLFVESYDTVDPLTYSVSDQTASLLSATGVPTACVENPAAPTAFLKNDDKIVVSVYEGCNGLNVMIVFVAFTVAFGGSIVKMLWFVPSGIIIIHIFNLMRLSLLYHIAIHNPDYFYYFHKYLFTAILYLIVFALWAIWVLRFYERPGIRHKNRLG